MEPMMLQYVLPELANQSVPMLRLRAVWFYGEFGEVRGLFKDDNHVRHAVDAIYKNLYDEELPVRFTAGTSIYRMLSLEQARLFLRPALKDILQVYLKLMADIESEDLVNALEEIVSLYKDDIAPYAL